MSILVNLNSRDCDRRLVAFKLKLGRSYKTNDLICNPQSSHMAFFKHALRGIALFDMREGLIGGSTGETYAERHAHGGVHDELVINWESYEAEKAERVNFDAVQECVIKFRESVQHMQKVLKEDKKNIKYLNTFVAAHQAECEKWKIKYQGYNEAREERLKKEYEIHIGKRKKQTLNDYFRRY